MTDNLHHIQPVLWKSELWIVAGWTGDWPATERDIENVVIYSPAQDRLRTGCEIPVEYRTGAAGVVVHQDMIYVVAGASNGHLREHGATSNRKFSRFDPAACAWHALPPVAHNRDHFTAVLIGSTIVAAGGRDSARSMDPSLAVHWQTAPTELYDLASSGPWRIGADIPNPRGGAAAVALGSRVVVMGGETGSGRFSDECPSYNPNLAWTAVDVYDLAADSWQPLPDMLVGRHAFGAAVFPVGHADAEEALSPTIYVAAGVGCTGGEPLLTGTEALTISESMAERFDQTGVSNSSDSGGESAGTVLAARASWLIIGVLVVGVASAI